MCVLTTIFKHHDKVLITKKLQEFDLFVSRAFNLPFDTDDLSSKIKDIFLNFLIFLFAGYVIFGVSVLMVTPKFLKFLLFYFDALLPRSRHFADRFRGERRRTVEFFDESQAKNAN
jgi:hypothetical protein